ncbi:hypothetical protein BCY86_04070 [Pajaroellobacter abortibovis]|uniref:Uncharacterized protein n=1 Tax=Pajaroellobacter abortibovis TaxID=1882918 RepID=A0A1L6MX00_9BACT|nr:hypothetical protein BCY86_04070 [Pajaroellobacter abortibovis]
MDALKLKKSPQQGEHNGGLDEQISEESMYHSIESHFGFSGSFGGQESETLSTLDVRQEYELFSLWKIHKNSYSHRVGNSSLTSVIAQTVSFALWSRMVGRRDGHPGEDYRAGGSGWGLALLVF